MKRRLLLVDDDLAVLLTLKTVLELNGFEVETANGSAEAFERLKSATYEMVITDLRMETEEAGLEVLRVAREQSYAPATALLTAYPPSGEIWDEHSAESLLVKPIGTQALVRQLEALLIQNADQRQLRRQQEHTSPSALKSDQRKAG
jgi:DNA-binding NtrC family response regulator